MGIDIYLRAKKQTEEERKAQLTGFAEDKGNVGYLREAYHGGPYATEVLMPEAFVDGEVRVELPSGEEVAYSSLTEDQIDSEQYEMLGVPIPAAVLRERLPTAKATTVERYRKIYPGQDPSRMVKSLEDFVTLAERKEREQDGKPCYVYASY